MQKPRHMRPRYTPFAIVAVCTIPTCREGSSPSGPPGPPPDQPQAVDGGPDLRTHPGVPVSLTTRVGDPDTGRWTASWGDGSIDTVSFASGAVCRARPTGSESDVLSDRCTWRLRAIAQSALSSPMSRYPLVMSELATAARPGSIE